MIKSWFKSAVFVTMGYIFSGSAWAQSRYDDHNVAEQFVLRMAAYRQIAQESSIRIDSGILGIGTLIELEDDLNVQDETSTVLRIGGFYRFNDRHRSEWSIFKADRSGRSELLSEEIQIGDQEYQIGSILDTKSEFTIAKVGWAWSFINVEPYEFYLGLGLNIRKLSFNFRNVLIDNMSGEPVNEYNASETLPLPTMTFGGRYNYSEKLMLVWRYEIFRIKFGDNAGRFQDTSVMLEHNTFENVGLGVGVSSYNALINIEKGRLLGEVENSYLGLLFYAKINF